MLPRRLYALVAVCAAAFALTPLTATAPAQEVPVAVVEEPPAPGSTEPPVEPPPPPPASGPASDPAPPPEPSPSPADPPQPPPDADQPNDPQSTTTPDEQKQPAPNGGERDNGTSYAAPATTAPVSFNTAAQTQVAPAPAPTAAPVTTDPLGWDQYDDALFAETVDPDGGAPDLSGVQAPRFGALAVFGGVVAATAERERRADAEPPARATAMPAGGPGSGGPGPGQGPSLSLFGGSGGSAAGIALLTLMGMLVGWLLMAPDHLRAFRSRTATWRPSAYVPPIEHPG